jgi:hypothetical protein
VKIVQRDARAGGRQPPPAVIGDLSFGTMRIRATATTKRLSPATTRRERREHAALFVPPERPYIIRASTFTADTIGRPY